MNNPDLMFGFLPKRQIQRPGEDVRMAMTMSVQEEEEEEDCDSSRTTPTR